MVAASDTYGYPPEDNDPWWVILLPATLVLVAFIAGLTNALVGSVQ